MGGVGRWLYLTGTLPETNESHLKMDGWKTSFLVGWPIFRCYVGWTHVKLPWLWEEGYFSYLQSWMPQKSKVQSAGLAKWKGVRLLMLRMKKAWQPILRLFFSGNYRQYVNKYMWMCVCFIRGSIRTSSFNPPYCSMKRGNQMFQPTQITKWRFLICSIMIWGQKLIITLPETTVT